MGISSSSSRMPAYTGNGVTSVFAYTFPIFANTDLRVIKRLIATGAETLLVLTTDYTVSGVGDSAGGNVTLVAGAMAATYKLIIRRARPLTQSKDIRNQGDFFPETHEDAFDHGVMLAQQLQDEADRCLQLPETLTDSDFNMDLPSDVNLSPLKIFGVNSAGTGVDLFESSEVAALSAQASHAVTDNQAAADLTGETVNSSLYTSRVYDYEIIRGTTVFSTGRLSLHYRSSTWYVCMGEDRRDDSSAAHGVTFSVTGTTTAQLQAALDAGAGNGTIKLKSHKFNA